MNWAGSVRRPLKATVTVSWSRQSSERRRRSPASAADPTVAAAGNIACDTTSPYFKAARDRDSLPSGRDREAPDRWHGAVLALGSTQYCCGTLAAFQASYDTSWGAAKAITHPVPGTRDYATPGAGRLLRLLQRPRRAERAGGPARPRLLQLRSRQLASRRAQHELLSGSCAAGSAAGALAARRPRRPPDLLHARLLARAPVQLGKPGGVLSISRSGRRSTTPARRSCERRRA